MQVNILTQHFENYTIYDVRAPCEFVKGHIPGAINIPILTDSARAAVGLCYKQKGQREAIRLGLELINLHELLDHLSGDKLVITCARGGMRSQIACLLAKSVGVEALQLVGGYKAFRQHMHAQFIRPINLHVLAGKTGVGKTEILHTLAAQGKHIIDLEALANHRGSAFGAQATPQPNQEMFENHLGMALVQTPAGTCAWAESESRSIGKCILPEPFYQRLIHSPQTLIESPEEERIERILRDYAGLSCEQWKMCLTKIERRLGRERKERLCSLIDQGDRRSVIKELLCYYDKKYRLKSVEPIASCCHLYQQSSTV